LGLSKACGLCALNPLKQGHVERVIDWPYSTFHRYVAKDIYPANWCGNINAVIDGDD
jgi:putative transposase